MAARGVLVILNDCLLEDFVDRRAHFGSHAPVICYDYVFVGCLATNVSAVMIVSAVMNVLSTNLLAAMNVFVAVSKLMLVATLMDHFLTYSSDYHAHF